MDIKPPERPQIDFDKTTSFTFKMQPNPLPKKNYKIIYQCIELCLMLSASLTSFYFYYQAQTKDIIAENEEENITAKRIPASTIHKKVAPPKNYQIPETGHSDENVDETYHESEDHNMGMNDESAYADLTQSAAPIILPPETTSGSLEHPPRESAIDAEVEITEQLPIEQP